MNKNKQNKVSFADLARKIQSKYKRAEYDPLEKADMEAELEALQVEQEYMRTQLGMNEPPEQQFRYGGKMYPNGGGFNPLPFNLNALAPQKLPEDAYLTPEQLSEGVSSRLDNSVGTKAVKDYIGGMPNIYERALPNSYAPSVNPIMSSGYNKGLSSTPGNEILYNNVTPSVIPKVNGSSGKKVNTTTSQTSPEVQNNILSKLMYRTNNNSLVDNPDYAKFHNVERLGQTPDTKSLQAMNTLSPKQIALMQKEGNNGEGNNFWDKNKQHAPYAISGVSNIASNLLLANMAKKNQQRVNPSLVTPEKMNIEPQAEQLRKDAIVSKNIGLKQARDLGLNAGATLANMGAIGSGVDRNLANSLTSLYGQQEQYNTGTANQFALQNQDAVNIAGTMNTQLGQQAKENQLGYMSGAMGTIPGVMKDVRMDKADKEMRGIMDAYYKSSGGKNYLAVGSIFDTDFGKYKVKGHNPDGTPITEKVK